MMAMMNLQRSCQKDPGHQAESRPEDPGHQAENRPEDPEPEPGDEDLLHLHLEQDLPRGKWKSSWMISISSFWVLPLGKIVLCFWFAFLTWDQLRLIAAAQTVIRRKRRRSSSSWYSKFDVVTKRVPAERHSLKIFTQSFTWVGYLRMHYLWASWHSHG